MAGEIGYDVDGYLDGHTLREQADQLGCFSFSLPDDLPVPDQGIRRPDNLAWADDGFIYIRLVAKPIHW